MNIDKFADMLLKGLEKVGVPAEEVEQIKADNSLFGIATSDKSQFLIKIGKRDPEQEAFLLEMNETDSRIHEIYEKFTNSWEYNHTLMHNDFDIDWLMGELEIEDYQKLEDYILYYCSRNDELIFRLGFKYAWELFTECATE